MLRNYHLYNKFPCCSYHVFRVLKAVIVQEVTGDLLQEEEYNDSLEYIACCVEAEAGNQSELGKRLVCAPVETENDGIIEGRNAVIEALRAGTTIDKIFIQKGETDKTLGHIASTARAAGVVVVDADKRKLDFMSRTHAHQGVIALTSVREYVSVEDILNIAREKGENPLIVVCDEISDPHNLGAIIRTAECAGAHGVIIPKRRSAGLTSIVAKTSAGAVSYVPVARVPNIPALLEQLQKEGVWVFGTAAEGTSDLYSADLKGPAAIVIGSEGDGMTRLVREKCDFLVSIPMKGKISSLNASAAAAILLYEAVRQRLGQ